MEQLIDMNATKILLFWKSIGASFPVAASNHLELWDLHVVFFLMKPSKSLLTLIYSLIPLPVHIKHLLLGMIDKLGKIF